MILCDLMMPEISGIDVYQTLRRIDPVLLDHVVLMTGGAFTARAWQFLSEVDALVLEKPFHPEQLHDVVNALGYRHMLSDLRTLPSAWPAAQISPDTCQRGPRK